MRALNLIWIYIIIGSVHLYAQDTAPQILLADQYYDHGQYDEALKEYLRAYVYNPKDANETLVKISELYKLKGETDEAVRYLNLAFFATPPQNPQRQEIQYKKAQLLIVEKDFQKAKLEVLQIASTTSDATDRITYYKVLVYLLNEEVDQGLKAMSQLSYHDSIDARQILKLEKKLKRTYKIKPKIYQIASGMLPGLGQYIAGDIEDGTKSLLLNGSLVYAFFRLGQTLTYSDAFVTVSPWIFRYFMGGVQNAGKAAKAKRERKKYKYIKSIMQEIEMGKEKSRL